MEIQIRETSAKRTESVTIRCTESDKRRIERLAKHYNTTITDLLLQLTARHESELSQ